MNCLRKIIRSITVILVLFIGFLVSADETDREDMNYRVPSAIVNTTIVSSDSDIQPLSLAWTNPGMSNVPTVAPWNQTYNITVSWTYTWDSTWDRPTGDCVVTLFENDTISGDEIYATANKTYSSSNSSGSYSGSCTFYSVNLSNSSTVDDNTDLSNGLQVTFRIEQLTYGGDYETSPDWYLTSLVEPKTVPSIAVPSYLNADGAVTISWSNIRGSNGGATKYGLQYSPGDELHWQSLATPSGESYTHNAGDESDRYYYRVYGINDACSPTQYSPSYKEGGPVKGKPYPPSSISYPVNGSEDFTVTWSSSYGAETYYLQIYRSDTGWVDHYNGTATSHSVDVGDIDGESAGRYKYRVKATNRTGDRGTWREGTNYTVVPPVIPASITYPSTDSDGNYTVSWSSNSQNTFYQHVLEEQKDGGSWNELYNGTATSKNFSSKSSGTYCYRVKNITSEGYYRGYRTGGTLAVEAETVSTPTTLTGPTSGTPGTTYTYNTGGSTCSLGHSVQYQFDWGDGSTSSWSSSTSATHSWTSDGDYPIKVRSRCATNTGTVSGWLTGLTMNIHTLYSCHVRSSNPDSGVTISYSRPGDSDSGPTPYSLGALSSGDTVSLTTPATAPNGNTFQKWQKDGSDYSTNRAVSYTVNGTVTMTAVYTSGTVTADIYEPDNDYTQSKPIQTDGTVQHHTLHSTTDGDWVAFQAVSGVQYNIAATNIANGSNSVWLYLYDTDGTAFISPTHLNSFTWTPSVSGQYYINVGLYESLTCSYDLSITGDTPPSPGQLQFSASSYNVDEDAGSVTITVTRTGGSDGAVSVNYSTSDGTATAGSDYTATSGTLNWTDGNTSNKTFNVPIIDDNITESNETVNMTLSNPGGGATLGSPNVAVLTICSEEGSSISGRVTHNGSGLSGVTVIVSSGVPQYEAVTDANGDYTITDITHEWTNAYLSAHKTGYTFEPGNYSGINTVGYPAITGKNFTATEEDQSQLQFSASSYNVDEDAGSVAITVTRTGGSDGSVSVDYATSNGTAIAGSDYTAASGTLNWTDGDTENKTFNVSITNDDTYEENETINLALSAPTNGATLGSPSTAVLTISDDDPVAENYVTLDMKEKTSPANADITVPLYLICTGNVQPASFQVDVNFDSTKLTFVEATAGQAATDAGKTVTPNEVEPGIIRLLIAGLNQNIIGDGTVVHFTLHAGDIADGNYPLILSNALCSDPTGSSVVTDTDDGNVNVGGDPYDPNDDGATNIFDVQICINQALGQVTGHPDADCNNDGTVNIFDVQLIINCVLGL